MDYEKVSQVLKALGHPLRLKIVYGLLMGKCCVNDISEKLNTPQSTISQHLATLRNAGIIIPIKEGVTTCYTVTDELAKQIIHWAG